MSVAPNHIPKKLIQSEQSVSSMTDMELYKLLLVKVWCWMVFDCPLIGGLFVLVCAMRLGWSQTVGAAEFGRTTRSAVGRRVQMAQMLQAQIFGVDQSLIQYSVQSEEHSSPWLTDPRDRSIISAV